MVRAQTCGTCTSSTLAVTSDSMGSGGCRTAPASCGPTSGNASPGCCNASSSSSTGDGRAVDGRAGRRSSWPSTASRPCGRRWTPRPMRRAGTNCCAIVAEGASIGIVSVVTAERPGAVPAAVLAACADRWVFHLDDPSEASACGVRAVAVPAAIPGRIVVASTGLEAQLASRRVEPSLGGPVTTARPGADRRAPDDRRRRRAAGRHGDRHRRARPRGRARLRDADRRSARGPRRGACARRRTAPQRADDGAGAARRIVAGRPSG